MNPEVISDMLAIPKTQNFSLWDTTHQRSRKKKFSDFRENLTDYNSKPLEIFLFLFWQLRFFFRFSFVFNSMYGLL